MFIKGIIDRLVKDFGLVLRRVVVFMCPGVPGTVCSGGLGRIQGRGCRGKGPYRVGGVILERRSPSCRRGHTALKAAQRRDCNIVAVGMVNYAVASSFYDASTSVEVDDRGRG